MPTPAGTTDLAAVRRAYRALEPLHSFVYFAPEAQAELLGLGLRPGRMPYLAQRSAAMGAVGAAVVVATFAGFAPAAVARSIPRAWSLASPADVLQARWRAVVAGLTRLLDGADAAEVDELTSLASRVAAACRPEGRPLFAAHADVEVPDDPLARLWQPATLLREHRGDAHVAVLVASGLSGLQALVLHTASGRGFEAGFAASSRGWEQDHWQEAATGLVERGLLDADGDLTDNGRALREQMELATDVAAGAPFGVLDDAGTARLTQLARSLSRRVLAAGAFPPGVFARPAR